jgi:hypothetical protein
MGLYAFFGGSPLDAAARQSFPERISQPAPLQEQIAFARHNFENQQSTIRAADTKVGAVLTIVFIVTVIAIPIVKEAIPRLHFAAGAVVAGISIVFLASCAVFVLGVLQSLALVVKVVRPRGVSGRSDPATGAPGQLLFYKHVLAHRNPKEYFEAVDSASSERLLRNLTDQIFELARICQEKMDALDAVKHPLRCALYSWALIVALGIWLGTRG